MYAARIEADSISPDGDRLTTLVVTFPRFILAEFNTHRVFSRNAASSRAIPVEKRIEAVMTYPFVPAYWGANQKGMQASEQLSGEGRTLARARWLEARDAAVTAARKLLALNVHKQTVNRLLEPFAWVTVIVSATEWGNFFSQRCHPDAQPEFRQVAEMLRDQLKLSTPAPVPCGGWHLPFTTADEKVAIPLEDLKRIAVGRCARVSYLTHDGVRDYDADIDLCRRLEAADPPHASPFEHVATPGKCHPAGNFRGWDQWRHLLLGR